ncbi:MAG: hypothetical protein Q4P20_09975 [Eubacteriales bacterium]|nr:hypothetical protein [Eubacteriales bacterium]
MVVFGNVALERRILEQTYDGVMDVYGYGDELTQSGATRPVEKQLYTGIACGLSASTQADTTQTDASADVNQRYIVFCAPEIEIHPGCRIVITQYGVTREYTCSGMPNVYPTHQELSVLLEERA